ncbi:rod shape-determining protein MreD [Streptococcus cameli]
MKSKYLVFLTPIVLFALFFIDSQLTTVLTNLSPRSMFISSYLILIFGFFCSKSLPWVYNMIAFTFVGLFYDLYYFGIVGIAVTLFPLVIYFIHYVYQNIPLKQVTNFMLLVIIIFFFEFLSFLFARLFQLTNLSMFLFVFYDLMPSLVFNSLILLLIQPLFFRWLKITNKT